MNKADVSTAMGALAVVALRDAWLRLWHKMNACSCDRGWILSGIPCEIGREEIEERQRVEFFSRWDALGLGYIGPRAR